MGGGFSATWRDGTITLNIDVAHLWDDPLGEESVGTILHECAHDKVSGHSISFQDEIAGLGARLAAWVAENPSLVAAVARATVQQRCGSAGGGWHEQDAERILDHAAVSRHVCWRWNQSLPPASAPGATAAATGMSTFKT